MGKIAHVLATKGAQVYTINEAESVFEAVKKMVELNTGCLLVTEGEEIRGIVTERDYLRGIALAGRTSKETQVREIMTSRIVVVQPDTPVEEAMAIMTDRRMKQISQDHKFEIQYLTDYIRGKYPG